MKWLVRILVLGLFFVLPSPLLTSVSAQSYEILLTGRVTSEDTGAPLANVSINFTTGLDTVEVARTDSSGYYTVTQTLFNNWIILFKPSDGKHFDEYYDNIPLVGEGRATTFDYVPGMLRHGIDAALVVKGDGQIRGTVISEADHRPLAGVYVEVYDGADRLEYQYTYKTDSNGVYAVTDLAAGGYKLKFNPVDAGEFYASEYSDGALNLATAQVIQVKHGEVVDGVDATLGVGGVITGFVQSNLGAEISLPAVKVYDQSSQEVTRGDPCYGENCTYKVTNLPPGDYRLFFRDRENGFRPSYYNGQSTLDQAQAVTVRAGEVTPNINVTLTYTPVIVSLATSKALPGILVVGVMGDLLPHYSLDDGHSWQRVPTSPVANHNSGSANYYLNPNVALVSRSGLSGQRILASYGYFYSHSGGGELYRSGDNGQSWAQIQSDPCNEVGSGSATFSPWTVSPADPSHIYFIGLCTYSVGEDNRVSYWLTKSTDGGVTWQSSSTALVGFDLDYKSRSSLVPSPMLANRLYYRNVSNNSHTSWSESDDNGETWKDRDFPIDFLALDGQNPNHLYGWRLGDLTSTYLPVGVRSEDDGDHWMQWAQQPCTPVDGDLLVSPFRSGLLFIHCSLGFGFFRSENGGDSWTKLPPIKGELWVADYSHPGRLLLAPDDSGELRQSLDNGESWQLLRPAGGVSPAQNRQPLYLPSITTQGH